MRPLRVLVVEDDDSIREMIHLALVAAGHFATGAVNGEEALELFASGIRPDVILLDLRMPVVDGVEFLRRYAAMGGQVPVVLLTAGRDLAEARGVGAAELVEKPFDLDVLLATIARSAKGEAAAAD